MKASAHTNTIAPPLSWAGPGSRPLSTGARTWGVLALFLMAAGCQQYEAVSVYPPMVYDDEQAQVYIYGHGFETGATAVLSWTGPDGSSQTAPLEQVEVLDAYTMRGYLPDVSGQVPHPIYPYQEFVTLSATYTPGLYACNSEEDATPQPVLWEEGSTGPYCDNQGNRLAYVGPDGSTPLVPPGTGDDSVLDYSSWYDLLDYCTWFLSQDTTLDEEHLSLLVPDYGLGCFYPAGAYDDDGRPTTYTYCPLKLPTVEVDVVVTLPDGRRSEISRGLTLIDWSLDYYWNPRYGTRIKGFFDPTTQMALDASISAATLADLNQDGYTDILAATDTGLLGMTGPSFDTAWTPTLDDTTTAPTDIAVADIDSADTGGGLLDLITVHPGEDPEAGGTLAVHFDLDPTSMTFDRAASAALPFSPTTLAVADLNQDGRLDFVVAGTDETGNHLLTTVLQDSQAPETFSVSPPFLERTAPIPFAVGRLDANQAADIVVVDPELGTLSAWYNDGTGTLDGVTPQPLGDFEVTGPLATSRITASGAIQPPRLEDLTGDGTTDIAVLDRQAWKLIVLTESESGPLTSTLTLDMDSEPATITLGTANADGTPDLIVGDTDGTVWVVTNHLPDGLTRLSSTAPGTPVDALLAHDLDGDGYTDIATLDSTSGTVSVLGNTYTSIGLYFYYILEQCSL